MSDIPVQDQQPGSDPIKVEVLGFDHLVIRAADPEVSLDFYVNTLGLTPERVVEWRSGTVPFPSVRVSSGVVIDLDGRAGPTGKNVEHFCLEIAPTNMQMLWASGAFEVVGDPVRRWGARGPADLIYVADPDGNVIELRHYGDTAGLGYGVRR
jgi:catechol 2,3-dioxygenase-like lactoylglutathione lyase family enzyme